jgi:hypothetical protein
LADRNGGTEFPGCLNRTTTEIYTLHDFWRITLPRLCPLLVRIQEQTGLARLWHLSFPHLLHFRSTFFSSGGLPSSWSKGAHWNIDICLKEKNRINLAQEK